MQQWDSDGDIGKCKKIFKKKVKTNLGTLPSQEAFKICETSISSMNGDDHLFTFTIS